ncbi:MAG: hypothetical protein F4X01_11110 [Nitrospira sp. SB0661_bin_20]|nr:hypothetical protein [Nitrospira sp. SB0661_bin_20]MYJ23457.1 hypothetical protein [Nitrospira sp. SB0673_bin_12]
MSRQDNNIDVLCIINGRYAILIEDKTNTIDHSGQLPRYLRDVMQRDYGKTTYCQYISKQGIKQTTLKYGRKDTSRFSGQTFCKY